MQIGSKVSEAERCPPLLGPGSQGDFTIKKVVVQKVSQLFAFPDEELR